MHLGRWTTLSRFALFAILGVIATGSQALAKNIMVFAPHPDDEILMSAGAIADGITRGDTVTVVVVTNGDISGVAKGYTRERESVAALAYLGLNDQKIVFLGYGDGSTIQIYKADTDTSVITSPAGQTQTYGARASTTITPTTGRRVSLRPRRSCA